MCFTPQPDRATLQHTLLGRCHHGVSAPSGKVQRVALAIRSVLRWQAHTATLTSFQRQ